MPPALVAAPPSPALAELARRLVHLAGLPAEDLGAPRGQPLLTLADHLPTSLPAAAFAPLAGALRRLVVALDDAPEASPDDPPRRLVVEVELAQLGRIRLDGLADQGRFDVLVAGAPDVLRTALGTVSATVSARIGLGGSLGFHDGPTPRSGP